MCGIFCSVLTSFPDAVCSCKKLEENIRPLFCRRGPDFVGQREVKIPFPSEQNVRSGKQENDGTLAVRLSASVLHLRGDNIAEQPLQDNNGNILAWNGEIFSGLKVDDAESDTEALLNNLHCLSNGDVVQQILKTVEVIEGPWGFVYYQAQQHCLWFGRDYFGRRSLLWHHPTSSTDLFAISSVGKRDGRKENFWEELPADGIYCMDLRKLGNYFLGADCQEYSGTLTKYTWQHSSYEPNASISLSRGPKCPLRSAFNKELPTNSSSSSPFLKLSERCNLQYEKAGQEHLTAVATVASVVHCDASDTPGETDAKDSSGDFAATQPGNVELPLQAQTSYSSPSLIKCHIDHKLVTQFVDILTGAVRKRVFNLPRAKGTEMCHHLVCEKQENSSHECCKKRQYRKRSKVGILFSGGLDSIVLAALADRCIPPEESIDLINVAFEQKTANKGKVRKGTNKNQQHKKEVNIDTLTRNFNAPDRITGRNGIAELKALNPERSWNFIEVNITLEELQDARSQFITHLVYPQSTVLDDSIGCALWFAARGSGTLICQQCLENITDLQSSCTHLQGYTSPAKVVLVGMGADEQLGGYARHRSRFNKEGWQGLMEEMEMEVLRISERNLGRDDRCISDHGREARYPFLDENVVSFLNSLPVWIKCDPRLDRGIGEKIILRQAAKFIGLTGSSELPKRAIQFGSRIAKLESSSEKGSEKCHRLR